MIHLIRNRKNRELCPEGGSSESTDGIGNAVPEEEALTLDGAESFRHGPMSVHSPPVPEHARRNVMSTALTDGKTRLTSGNVCDGPPLGCP